MIGALMFFLFSHRRANVALHHCAISSSRWDFFCKRALYHDVVCRFDQDLFYRPELIGRLATVTTREKAMNPFRCLIAVEIDVELLARTIGWQRGHQHNRNEIIETF